MSGVVAWQQQGRQQQQGQQQQGQRTHRPVERHGRFMKLSGISSFDDPLPDALLMGAGLGEPGECFARSTVKNPAHTDTAIAMQDDSRDAVCSAAGQLAVADAAAATGTGVATAGGVGTMKQCFGGSTADPGAPSPTAGFGVLNQCFEHTAVTAVGGVLMADSFEAGGSGQLAMWAAPVQEQQQQQQQEGEQQEGLQQEESVHWNPLYDPSAMMGSPCTSMG